jgi:hypothetical protein
LIVDYLNRRRTRKDEEAMLDTPLGQMFADAIERMNEGAEEIRRARSDE